MGVMATIKRGPDLAGCSLARDHQRVAVVAERGDGQPLAARGGPEAGRGPEQGGASVWSQFPPHLQVRQCQPQ